MDIIKSYLRTTEEFCNAYDLLKEKYQEKVAWFVDALELVIDGEPVIIDGKPLSVNLNDVFALTACKNSEMMITERAEDE